MPPQRGHSPPVDPFPPLRRSGTSSTSNPSYASIAARTSHYHPSDRHDLLASELVEEEDQRGWEPSDVDRDSVLDEMNPYAGAINIDPSPPWRTGHRSHPIITGEGGGDHTTSTRPRVHVSGGFVRNPLVPDTLMTNSRTGGTPSPRNASQPEVINTPPPSEPSRPSNRSPPSPSPTRPTREEPAPASGLAPFFTLSDLLQSTHSDDRENNASSSNTNSASRPNRAGESDLEARRSRRRVTYNGSPWGLQMERALPTGAATRYDDILNDIRRSSDPMEITFPTNNTTRTQITNNGRPLDGSGSTSSADQALTSFLRRRRRNPAPARQTIFETWDPDEVLPFGEHSLLTSGVPAQESDNENDSEGEGWASRLTIHDFSGGNREFDVDGPGPARSRLSRGSNNRRRQSFLERIGAPPDLVFPEDTEDRIDFPPPLRGVGDATGCEPTNRELAVNIAPLIVRTGGVRRLRVEDDEKKDDSPIRKKTRTRSPVQHEKTLRPTYLDISTLPTHTPLPAGFEAPLRRSHLALTTHTSATHSPRPLITFIGCNPTRGDNDATSLHTVVPIPLTCGVHYYEVEVIDKGEEGFMSVGWMKRGSNLRRLVGWDKGSWGWHGDDGRSFEGQGRGERFSETWTTGDTVGCGVDLTSGRAFFTKNGKMMGHRFSSLSSDLHPAVGLRSVGESLAVDFTGPFKFDIDSYVSSTKKGIWRDITTKTVYCIPRLVDQVSVDQNAAGEKGSSKLAKALKKELDQIENDKEDKLPEQSPLNQPVEKATSSFVLDYLRHNGNEKALSILHKSMVKRNWISPPAIANQHNGGQDTSVNSIPRLELKLSDFASKNQALIWLSESISSSFANLVPHRLIDDLASKDQDNTSLKFPLAMYDFLHLLYLSAIPAATDDALDKVVKKGQTLRFEMKSWASDQKGIVERAFGILGQPEQLNDDYWSTKRSEWAATIIQTLRAMNGINQVSHLEQSLRQTGIVLKTLAEKSGKSGAAYVELKKILEANK
ncbi:uncharacterized protein IL334_000264 [Kwoniella shivajii]|uniref:B30.2/SPRY domain-containing protein n=1 Tax=Kwoniella shivajii TaxID=564305 RepID=A0ABZ1CPQ9_9TREE|nr:hypothetical protein IL334_000264 [Kwoniella shivajii]